MAAPPDFPAGVFHVAGVLVHALPGSGRSVGQRICQVPGAFVHAESADGKLVVTIESEDGAYILDQLTQLQHMSGVMSAVLVSEHSEPLSAADEVLSHDIPEDAP
ncbi:MAG TPA: chaperone NapD [Ramlibacter sp.]